MRDPRAPDERPRAHPRRLGGGWCRGPRHRPPGVQRRHPRQGRAAGGRPHRRRRRGPRNGGRPPGRGVRPGSEGVRALRREAATAPRSRPCRSSGPCSTGRCMRPGTGGCPFTSSTPTAAPVREGTATTSRTRRACGRAWRGPSIRSSSSRPPTGRSWTALSGGTRSRPIT